MKRLLTQHELDYVQKTGEKSFPSLSTHFYVDGGLNNVVVRVTKDESANPSWILDFDVERRAAFGHRRDYLWRFGGVNFGV